MNAAVVAETLRRHFTSAPYLFYTGFMLLVGAGAAYLSGRPGQWQFFVGLLIIAAGAQLIGPEFSSGTLQLILTKPVNRSVYVISRYAGVILAIWIPIWLAVAADAIVLIATKKDPMWSRLLSSSVNLSAGALLTCALLAFFGTFRRAYGNVVIYLVLQVIFSFLLTAIEDLRSGMGGITGALTTFFANHPHLGRSVAWLGHNLFPDRPAALNSAWLLLVASNSAVVMVCACLVFRNREVPYGAD